MMAESYEFPDAAETDEIAVTVYPNPAVDFITINTDTGNFVKIIDPERKLIYNTIITAFNTFVNVKDYERGIYSVMIKNAKEARIIKILKI